MRCAARWLLLSRQLLLLLLLLLLMRVCTRVCVCVCVVSRGSRRCTRFSLSRRDAVCVE